MLCQWDFARRCIKHLRKSCEAGNVIYNSAGGKERQSQLSRRTQCRDSRPGRDLLLFFADDRSSHVGQDSISYLIFSSRKNIVIGIVIVSHSAKLAEGVVELARNMGGADLSIQGAGGLNADAAALGTDPLFILNAIENVYSEDGVLVLMDLGSAILSAEMALDMLPEEKRGHVILCEAPIVEGAVAAAVQARIGSSIQQVIAETRGALLPKATHLNTVVPETSPSQMSASDENRVAIQLTVKNALGLHARPAARFVQTAGKFSQESILVGNLTLKKEPVNAKSINNVITLGVRQGHLIEVTVSGPNARGALDAIKALADNNFGDQETSASSENILSTTDTNISTKSSLT